MRRRARPPTADGLRGADLGEGERPRKLPPSMAAYLAGPVLTSIVLVGVSVALLPASDGVLQDLPQLNPFAVLAVGCGLGGLAVHVAATILLVRQLQASSAAKPTERTAQAERDIVK